MLFLQVQSTVVDFQALGALAEDFSDRAAWHNGRLLNETWKTLLPGAGSWPRLDHPCPGDAVLTSLVQEMLP